MFGYGKNIFKKRMHLEYNDRYSTIDKCNVRIMTLLFFLSIDIENAKKLKIQY